MIFIYSLSTKEEPDNIRYIGKSKNPQDRLKRHLQPYYLKEANYKSRWLNSVLAKGQTPIMEIIDCVHEDGWELWEQYWIEQFKAWGFKLTNCLPGGEGIPSTDDIIKRRSITNSKVFNEMKDKHNIRQENDMWLGERICFKCKKTIIHKSNNRSSLIKKIKLSILENRTCVSCITDRIKNITSKKTKEELRLQYQISAPKKEVIQFSKENILIKSYSSIREASRITGIDRSHISSCCRNKKNHNTAGGFIWNFK